MSTFESVNYKAVVVGASAGGITALQKMLAPLPADFRLPVLVVQHRLPVADDLMAFTLNASCKLKVKEADEHEAIEPGCVYLAPANYHLLVERNKTLSFSIDEKVSYSRPSIDVLFETAAEAYLSGLVGIILTGANQDGTNGMRKIKENGGLTIAQDPDTAEADIMPRSAIQKNVVDKVFSLPEIVSFLCQLSTQGIGNESNSR